MKKFFKGFGFQSVDAGSTSDLNKSDPLMTVEIDDVGFFDNILEELWTDVMKKKANYEIGLTEGEEEMESSMKKFLSEFLELYGDWDPSDSQVCGHPQEMVHCIAQLFSKQIFEITDKGILLVSKVDDFNMFRYMKIILRSTHNQVLFAQCRSDFPFFVMVRNLVDILENEEDLEKYPHAIVLIQEVFELLLTLTSYPDIETTKGNQQELRIRTLLLKHLTNYQFPELIEEILRILKNCQEQLPTRTFWFTYQKSALLMCKNFIMNGIQTLGKDKYTERPKGLFTLLSYLDWPLELKQIILSHDFDSGNPIAIPDHNRVEHYAVIQMLAFSIVTDLLSCQENLFRKLGSLNVFEKISGIACEVATFFDFEDKPAMLKMLKDSQPKKSYIYEYPPPHVREVTNILLYSKHPLDMSKPKAPWIHEYLIQLSKFVSLCTNFIYLGDDGNGLLLCELPQESNQDQPKYQGQLGSLFCDAFTGHHGEPRHHSLAKRAYGNQNIFQFYYVDQLLELSSNAVIFRVLLENGVLQTLFSSQFLGNLEGDKISDYSSLLFEYVLNGLYILAPKAHLKSSNRRLGEFLLDRLGSCESNSYLGIRIIDCLITLLEKNYSMTIQALEHHNPCSVISIATKNAEKKAYGEEKQDSNSEYEKCYIGCLNILNLILTSNNIASQGLQCERLLNILLDFSDDNQMFHFVTRHLVAICSTVDEYQEFELLMNILNFRFSSISSEMKEIPIDDEIGHSHPIQQKLRQAFQLYDVIHAIIQGCHRNRRVFQVAAISIVEECLQFLHLELPKSLYSQYLHRFLKLIHCLIRRNFRAQRMISTKLNYYLKLIPFLYKSGQEFNLEFFQVFFNIMVDYGEFDENVHFNIRNPFVIPLIFALCEQIETKIAEEIIRIFSQICSQSVFNRQAISSIDCIHYLLKLAKKHSVSDGSKSFAFGLSNLSLGSLSLIEIIGKHSINVRDLKQILSMITKEASDPQSALLGYSISILKKIGSAPRIPSIFDFEGNGSGLHLPVLKNFPSPNGYSLMTWFRMESILLSQPLFSFINEYKEGIQVTLKNSSLVMIVSKGNRSIVREFNVSFEEKTWYHVAIVHESGKTLFGANDTARLYVDGSFVSKVQIRYPQFTYPLNRNSFGSIISKRKKKKSLNTFIGQTTALYCIDDRLTEQQISSIYSLSYSYQSSFDPVEAPLFDKSHQYLFDKQFRSKIVFLFNPKSQHSDQVCLNNAPYQNLSLTATALKGTTFCIPHHSKDAITCLGGIKVLFPLFLQLDKISHETISKDILDQYLLNDVMALLVALVDGNVTSQREMVNNRDIRTLSALFKRVSPQHFNTRTLRILPQFLLSIERNASLVDDVLRYLLLDFDLWMMTTIDTQLQLITLIQEKDSIHHIIKKKVDIQFILDVLRSNYYYNVEKKVSHIIEPIVNRNTGEVLGSRPHGKELQFIRSKLLGIIRNILQENPTADNFLKLMSFLVVCRDYDQLIEILDFLFDLLLKNFSHYLPALAACNTCEVLVNLFKIANEDIRLRSLKLLGFMFTKHQPFRTTFEVESSLGASFFTDLLYPFPVTYRTYETLRDTFLGNFDDKFVELTEDSGTNFTLCFLPKTIFKLLLNADAKTRLMACQDWKLRLSNESIQSIMISQEGWQDWLLDLLANHSFSEESVKSSTKEALFQLILNILSQLLYHSLQNDPKGWKSLSDTLSYITLYQERAVLDSEIVLRRIYSSLLSSFLLSCEKKKRIEEMMKESFVYDNLLYLLQSLEEYIFHSRTMKSNLIKKWHDPSTLECCHILKTNEEIRIDENNLSFLDLPIVYTILNLSQLIFQAKFLNQLVSRHNERLYKGGYFRTILRMFKYYFLYSKGVEEGYIDMLLKIIKWYSSKNAQVWIPDVTEDVATVSDVLSYVTNFCLSIFESTRSVEDREKFIKLIMQVTSIYKSSIPKALLSKSSKLFTGFTVEQVNELLEEEKKYFSLIDAMMNHVQEQEKALVMEMLISRSEKIKEAFESKNFVEKKGIEFATQKLNHARMAVHQIRKVEIERLTFLVNRNANENGIASKILTSTLNHIAQERGPWENVEANRWKIDNTENGFRMRLRLKPDYEPMDHTRATHKFKRSSSASQLVQQSSTLMAFPQLANLKGSDLKEEDDEDIQIDKEIMQSIEQSGREKSILTGIYCEYITPMQAFSGTLDLTSERVIWIPDKENTCPIFGSNEITNALMKKPTSRVWKINQITKIQKRRYNLRRTAIELHFVNHKNSLINFNEADRKRVLQKLFSCKPQNLLPTIKLHYVTKRWQNGEISNFEYLMCVNTFANRTYNDLNQYPVFPWVIKDYTSETLDLNDPSIYRDLSKPVGALNEERLERILLKYESFDHPEIPKFHYGSHYSSSGIILYYLIRMEPFTTFARILQGGHFDHADRMFLDIAETWSEVNHGTDFKELIPEFYYNPEFLKLPSYLKLGSKQDGEEPGDVRLPPWAKTPEEFVAINRKALESDYVSKNLHHWIDLIFGYKQRGPEAVKANNVFYYLTYEGTVDFEKFDKHLRKSILSQIQNFGQTPSQIFKSEHPARLVFPKKANSKTLNQYSSLDTNSNDSITHLSTTQNENLICVSGSKVFTFTLSIPDKVPSESIIRFPFSHHIKKRGQCICRQKKWDFILCAGFWDSSVKMFSPNQEVFICNGVSHKDVVTCLASDSNLAVSGSRDATLTTWDIVEHQLKPRQLLQGHGSTVTCVDVSENMDLVLSGSLGLLTYHSLRSGKFIRSITLKSIDLIKIFHHNGSVLLYSKSEKKVLLYNINGMKVNEMHWEKTKIRAMELIGQDFFVTGDTEGYLRLYRANTFEKVYETQLIYVKNFLDQVFTDNSPSTPSTPLEEKTNQRSEGRGSIESIQSLHLNSEGNILYVGGKKGRIYIFTVTDAAEIS